MFVARCKELGYHPYVGFDAVEGKCMILDTDDCTIEEYTVKECCKIAKIMDENDMRGLYGFDTKLLSVKAFEFFELFDGKVRIRDNRIWYNGKPVIYIEYGELLNGTGFAFYDEDKSPLVLIEMNFTRGTLSSPFVYFVWAETLGKHGYRIILRLYYTGTMSGFYEIYVVLFMGADGRFGIGNIKIFTHAEYKVNVVKRSIEPSIESRLNLMGVF